MGEKPMNPYAKEDFTNAVNKATSNLADDLKKLGEKMKADFPFMDDPYVSFADMNETYGGMVRLDYARGYGAWQDVMNTLIAHGYVVMAYTKDATEAERELDNVDKWIVIEFSEVE